MKKIIAIIIILFSSACFAGSSPNSINPMSVVSSYFCLPAAPTVPVFQFIAPTLVDPIANGSTTIETTDGTYFYVITMSTGTGFITSLASCPVRYTTKQ